MQTPFDRYEHLPSNPFFVFLLRLSLSLLLLLLLCLCAFNKQFTLWINQKDITSKEWWKERKRRKKEKKRAHEVVRHKSVLILIGFGFNPLYEMANGQNLPVFRDLNLNRKYFQIMKKNLPVPCSMHQNLKQKKSTHIIYKIRNEHTPNIDKISVAICCFAFHFVYFNTWNSNLHFFVASVKVHSTLRYSTAFKRVQ